MMPSVEPAKIQCETRDLKFEIKLDQFLLSSDLYYCTSQIEFVVVRVYWIVHF